MIDPAPFSLRSCVGLKENFFIHDGYQIQEEPLAFDDTGFRDEFQREVYEYARQVVDAEHMRNICDIGCGSGFKLITTFFDKYTLGVDLAPTVKFLNKKWPGREWCTPEELDDAQHFELAICSDVVEHLENPDQLMDTLRGLRARVILSTPERDQLCLGTHNGPPRNAHHVREWNFSELHAYVSEWFEIKEHFVVKGTQVVDCC